MYQQQDEQEHERIRFQKRRTEESISLAMESRWEEAAQANRDIIALAPNDHHCYNRLGKALMELGRYAEARDAYAKALELDSANVIAKRNLQRLATLGEEGPADGAGQKLIPHLFIAETGKSGMAVLENSDDTVVVRLTPGDQVELRRQDGGLTAHTIRGERIGDVGPPLGLRLSNLMEGGNMYAAAVVSVEDTQCKIIIREVFQHPSQEGRLSFPVSGSPASEPFRPYTRARLVRSDEGIADDENDENKSGYEWEEPDSGAVAALSNSDEDTDEIEVHLPDDVDDLDDEIEE